MRSVKNGRHILSFSFPSFPFYSRQEALSATNLTDGWEDFANETYISEAGWYFKTLAVQEIGEMNDYLNVCPEEMSYNNCINVH